MAGPASRRPCGPGPTAGCATPPWPPTTTACSGSPGVSARRPPRRVTLPEGGRERPCQRRRRWGGVNGRCPGGRPPRPHPPAVRGDRDRVPGDPGMVPVRGGGGCPRSPTPGPATGGSCWRPSAAGAGERAGAAGTSPGSPSSSTRAVLTRPSGSPDQARFGRCRRCNMGRVRNSTDTTERNASMLRCSGSPNCRVCSARVPGWLAALVAGGWGGARLVILPSEVT